LIFPRRRGRSDYAAKAAVWDLNSNSIGLPELHIRHPLASNGFPKLTRRHFEKRLSRHDGQDERRPLL
jgi:hypothetical protein